MKSLNIFAAATVALGLANSAYAQTKVYIAGAPALRQYLTTAVENLLVGQGSVTRSYNGSNILTANVITWTGANISGNPVTIKLTYNGSAGGWKTNSASQQVRFIDDSFAGANGNQTDVLSNTSFTPVENAVPDFHISNEYQISTPWSGTNATSNGPANTTYATLTDEKNGILPLRLVASKNAPNNLNITPTQAQQLYINGELDLSILTGDANDVGIYVYPLSRGIDSGIRTLWAEANGVKKLNNKSYQAFVNLGAGTSVVSVVPGALGSGYTSAPTASIGSTRGAGYTSAPTVVFNNTGTGGSGATATANVVSGRVESVTINTPGTGYTSAPVVTFSGGGFTTAATPTAVNISGGGVSFIGIGKGATATASISGGKVTGYTVTNGGQNFIANPSVTITGGGGVGATATAVIGGGTVTGQQLWPASTLLGINVPQGNGGYVTFGPLLSALISDTSAIGHYLAVLSDADAQVAFAAGAKEVAWNGNKLGTLGTYGNSSINSTYDNLPTGSASPALANGTYDLWGYSRLAYRSNLGTIPGGAVKLATKTAISNQLKNFDAPVLLKDVNVERSEDGGAVSPR